MLIRFIGKRAYWLGAKIGYIRAKFMLGYRTFYNPENPGNWID